MKIDGYLMGVIGNRQGLIPNYPEYTNEYGAVGESFTARDSSR